MSTLQSLATPRALFPRPLRAGEEAAWHDVSGTAANIAAKAADLAAYRAANPTLHPASFLVLAEGDRIVARLRTYSEDPTGYNLAALTVAQGRDYAADARALLSVAASTFTDRPLAALSWDTPEDASWHDALLAAGFRVWMEKHYFRRDLVADLPVYADPFTYTSLADIGEAAFLRNFVRMYPGNVNRDFNSDDPAADFHELRASAGRASSDADWLVAERDGAPCGILVPKRFDDEPEEGTIHTFGLFPQARRLGLGKVLHAKGLALLAAAGAKTYVGSTDRRNAAMVATFRANGCWDRGIRRQYRRETATAR